MLSAKGIFFYLELLWKLIESKISMSSTKFVFFGPIRKPRCGNKCGTLYSGARYVALWASCIFIRPSTDGTYYGMVTSVRVSDRSPSDSPSVRSVSDSPSIQSPSARFPHFSPTCFDILSWNLAHDFVLMYDWASSSAVHLRQFLKELCLFWNLEYRKYTVFRSFLLHALTYWAEILHMTLF